MIAHSRVLASILGTLATLGCGGEKESARDAWKPPDDSAPGPDGLPAFRDVTARTGISFRHDNGASPEKRFPEPMGSGVAVIDADGDGRLDLYFVDSGPVPGTAPMAARGGNRLYRNVGAGRFEDATDAAGLHGRGFGMGAIAADVDADGDSDLYVTCLGSNVLYRNEGGRFRDVTAASGADDPRWSTGAVFSDLDGDGDLDLFVQNYVDWDLGMEVPCHQGSLRIYCKPDLYDSSASSLFRNEGDGTFVDLSESSGIASVRGKGLAVCATDLDGDGLPEIYCANDLVWNFLFRNRGNLRFEEIGLVSGAGYSEEGREEAGMGVDAADLDGNGTLDLAVANFQDETNAIYRNDGALVFTEISRYSGTAEASLRRLGFGMRLFDYDSDGLQDLVVANGHIYDNASEIDPRISHAQPPTLYRGLGGGRLEDVTARAGKRFADPRVGRGLDLADLDEDGDLDLVLTENGGPPALFENVGGNANAWVSIRLLGTRRDRTAIGTRVTIEAEGRRQIGEVASGRSYLSQSDLRVFFGLGRAERIERLHVRWPDGSVEEARDVPVRRHLTFVEGKGVRLLFPAEK